MEKNVLINLHGFNIRVVLYNSSKMVNRTHHCYGEIFLRCPFNMPLIKIQKKLEKMYSKELLKKFPLDYLYDEDYCYILGEKRMIIRPFSYKTPQRGDIIVRSDEELKEKLNKLSYDIIVSRVRRYEAIMKTYKHEIKIASMITALGKNYYQKKVLYFSDKLIHFSLELIDSVVIHELVHDFVQNHSKKFYNILYSYCENYEEKSNKLIYGVKK